MVTLWVLGASLPSHLGKVMGCLGGLNPWESHCSSITN